MRSSHAQTHLARFPSYNHIDLHAVIQKEVADTVFDFDRTKIKHALMALIGGSICNFQPPGRQKLRVDSPDAPPDGVRFSCAFCDSQPSIGLTCKHASSRHLLRVHVSIVEREGPESVDAASMTDLTSPEPVDTLDAERALNRGSSSEESCLRRVRFAVTDPLKECGPPSRHEPGDARSQSRGGALRHAAEKVIEGTFGMDADILCDEGAFCVDLPALRSTANRSVDQHRTLVLV